MAKIREVLSTTAKLAKELLAITGLIGLIWTGVQYFDKASENIKPDVMVRPVHEELASKMLRYSDGSPAKYKVIGVEIKNDKDVSDLRIRLNGIAFAEKWSISAIGIAPEEVAKLVATLPTGIVLGKEIYIDMPRVMAKGDVLIQCTGATSSEFKPSSEWFNVSSASSRVYHGTVSEYLGFRELTYSVSTLNFYEYGFYSLAIPLLIYFLYKRAVKQAENEKGKEPAPNSSSEDQ